MSLAEMKWDHSRFLKAVTKKAMDGCEELASTLILSEAKENCPVGIYPTGSGMVGGTMRNSIGVERDDKNLCCYIGGGGPAKDYIFRQHQDMSLNHTTGKAKFISDALQSHSGKLNQYVEKHLKK
jgi:hypothetical protein